MNTGRLMAIAAALLLCLGASSAQADGANDRRRARALFQRAQEAIDVGLFPEAKRHLEESLLLSPNPATAYNLSVALRGTGEYIRASDVLRRLSEGKFGNVPRARRNELARTLRTISDSIAELRIVLKDPQQANAQVDGGKATSLRLGEKTAIAVDPGERRIRVSSKGYIPDERVIQLGEGDKQTIEVSLKSEQATLEVVALKRGDQLEIVGVGRAQDRIKKTLAPGMYVVRVYNRKGRYEREVELLPGASTRLQLAVPRKPLRKRPWFWVGLGLGAAGAAVGGYYLIRPGKTALVPGDTDPIPVGLRQH